MIAEAAQPWHPQTQAARRCLELDVRVRVVGDRRPAAVRAALGVRLDEVRAERPVALVRGRRLLSAANRSVRTEPHRRLIARGIRSARAGKPARAC